MLTLFRPLFTFSPDPPAGGGGGTATPPAPTPPPADPPPASPPSQTVPLDRFNEVIAQNREAQRERDELRTRLQELEDREKTEAQRATEAAAREKARADKAEADLAQTKRDTALRAAATAAGAISPDAIVALANQRGVEIDVDKPDTITKAIESMKGDKDNPGPDAALFGDPSAPAQPTQRFGVPQTPPPGTQTPPANSDDPKLALGQGLLAAIAQRRGG